MSSFHTHWFCRFLWYKIHSLPFYAWVAVVVVPQIAHRHRALAFENLPSLLVTNAVMFGIIFQLVAGRKTDVKGPSK